MKSARWLAKRPPANRVGERYAGAPRSPTWSAMRARRSGGGCGCRALALRPLSSATGERLGLPEDPCERMPLAPLPGNIAIRGARSTDSTPRVARSTTSTWATTRQWERVRTPSSTSTSRSTGLSAPADTDSEAEARHRLSCG